MKNVLLAGGAIAALVYFLKRKKTAAENIKVEPVDIAIDSQRSAASLFSRIYYRVKLRLINDELASVNVSAINLKIVVNGRELAQINNTTVFKVDSRSTQVINLDAVISTLGAVTIIKDLIMQGLNIDINVTGYLDTDLGRVTINFSRSL
jgi:LEA14-like dessication related protein